MIGLFAGTFDPPSLGHLDIIKRASLLVDKLYVAIAETSNKTATFIIEDRKKMLESICKGIDNAEVIAFSGLVVDCATRVGANCLIRGLRNGSDFNFEFQMASANRQMTGIETLFLASRPEYSHLNSTLIREIGRQGKSLSNFLPKPIAQEVLQHLQK